MPFARAFEKFLKAVQDHDFESMKSFLDQSLPLKVLLPGKPLIIDYDAFIESQKPYFENPNQKFDYEILEAKESGDLGFGVCKASLTLEDNQVFNLQICFLFQKVEDHWKMTFDQNTLL